MNIFFVFFFARHTTQQLQQQREQITKMPCYFDKMISKYFQCSFDEATDRVHDLENDYETRETLFYDFIDSTVYNFGPASYTVNTPTINKLCFEMWKSLCYNYQRY